MTSPDLDESTRFFLAAMLPKFPEALTRLMLADDQKRASLGLPAGDYVRLFGMRFERADLLFCLRELANDRPATLTSADGVLSIDKAELDPSGAGILTAGHEAARYANASMLSEDRARRLKTLDDVVADGEMDAGQEALWRAILEQRPLDDDEYIALETLIESAPEALYRRLMVEAADGLTFQMMVPDESELFAGLLGTRTVPDSLGDFRQKWLEQAAEANSPRLGRLLALNAPLAILNGKLIAPAARRLEKDGRLRLARFLAGAPDPVSVIAAFQIAADNAADPDFRALGDTALAQLADPRNERLVSGAVFLTSALILTAAMSAHRRTLVDWPVYARRLAWFLHASHLTRIFGNGEVDPNDMLRLAGVPMLSHARLIDLCDAHASPFNLQAAFAPAHIYALGLNRAKQALEAVAETERPEQWISALNGAFETAAKSNDALLMMAPSPFDPFEHDWPGLFVLPPEATGQMIGRMDAGTDDDAVMSDLIKLAIACEAGEDQRQALGERLMTFAKSRPDASFTPVTELALQLAARWRDAKLGEALIELALSRSTEPGLEDKSAAPRLVLLGAASNADAGDWARKAGEYASGFAFATKPGPAIVNLANAIDLIRVFAPALQAPLAPARSYTILAQNRLLPRAAPPAPAPAADEAVAAAAEPAGDSADVPPADGYCSSEG